MWNGVENVSIYGNRFTVLRRGVRERKRVFEIPVETGQVLYIEAVPCVVPFFERSRSLGARVIGTLLSRETLGKTTFVGGLWTLWGECAWVLDLNALNRAIVTAS